MIAWLAMTVATVASATSGYTAACGTPEKNGLSAALGSRSSSAARPA